MSGNLCIPLQSDQNAFYRCLSPRLGRIFLLFNNTNSDYLRYVINLCINIIDFIIHRDSCTASTHLMAVYILQHTFLHKVKFLDCFFCNQESALKYLRVSKIPDPFQSKFPFKEESVDVAEWAF